MNARRKPVQQRSRERFEQIIAAAADLMYEEGVDALSTRAIALRSGVPVATIYQYFADRDAIIATFLDRELELMDRAVAEEMLNVDRVTMRSMVETVARAHMNHHESHPKAVAIWFGGRASPAVIERVRRQDARMAAWLKYAAESAGLMRTDTPEFGAELVIRLFDRTFEFAFVTDRTAKEREEIVLTLVEIVMTYLDRFTTKTGREGISSAEFLATLGSGPVYTEEP
jgi:AcrR family transcriptional regulator